MIVYSFNLNGKCFTGNRSRRENSDGEISDRDVSGRGCDLLPFWIVYLYVLKLENVMREDKVQL